MLGRGVVYWMLAVRGERDTTVMGGVRGLQDTGGVEQWGDGGREGRDGLQ